MKYSFCVITNTGFDTILDEAPYDDCVNAMNNFDHVKYEQDHPGIIVEDYDIVPEGGHSIFE